jgi:hypothetical protein
MNDAPRRVHHSPTPRKKHLSQRKSLSAQQKIEISNQCIFTRNEKTAFFIPEERRQNSRTIYIDPVLFGGPAIRLIVDP